MTKKIRMLLNLPKPYWNRSIALLHAEPLQLYLETMSKTGFEDLTYAEFLRQNCEVLTNTYGPGVSPFNFKVVDDPGENMEYFKDIADDVPFNDLIIEDSIVGVVYPPKKSSPSIPPLPLVDSDICY